ncbi:MAG: putative ABC transporter permease, partial [Eubacterium sp.]|nr:putative ABC transporter permease [Eubacterium sp.]
ILWYLLGAVTLGLARLFWLNSYKTATMTEYFSVLRQDYIDQKKDGYELFNDKYLYEHASRQALNEAYADVFALKNEPRFEYRQKNPILRILRNTFGLVLFYDENEARMREQEVKDANLANLDDVINGKVYPGRLSAIEKNEKIKTLENLRYLRCYSILSVIMIFFIFCFIGWVWEVSLHLITDGIFVNRGVLHGPWLPIYGAGGTTILLLLYRFREKPWLEFTLAVILSGAVEYFTSWELQMSHDGTQWWNYDNYFLNLNGRVCAEGLLVFGLGGIAVVYLLAPMIDNQVSRINRRVLASICICLLAIYITDSIYSHYHPNSGRGITDYQSRYMRGIPGQKYSSHFYRYQ